MPIPGVFAAQVVSGSALSVPERFLANQKERSVRGLYDGSRHLGRIGYRPCRRCRLPGGSHRSDSPYLFSTDRLRPLRCQTGRAVPEKIHHARRHEKQYRPSSSIGLFVSDHQLHIKKFHNYSDDEAPFSEIELELTALSHLDAPEIISELLAVKGIKEADFYADDGQKKAVVGP